MTIPGIASLHRDNQLAARALMAGVILALTIVPASAQSVQIDSSKSVVSIRVFKSGVFSGFAHDHVVQAPIASGAIDLNKRSVTLTFNVADMKVLDQGASDSERKEIDATMKGPKVLDATQFPVISFTSNSLKTSGTDHNEVTGTLKIHGVSRQVTTAVTFHDGTYAGSLLLKQTDYGITPVKIAGGAVRVKDEITVEFTVMPASSTAPNGAGQAQN